MIIYNLRIAVKSLRRNPIVSLLMIGAIGVGIGTCMALVTIVHQLTGDPIPQKSNQLYAVQLDSRESDERKTETRHDVPPWVTYTDAMNLMTNDTPAKEQVIMSRVLLYSRGDNQEVKTKSYPSRATFRTFFSMFDVPFLFGSAWTQADDETASQVVVLSRDANDKLFGGVNSVGKQLMIADQSERYYEVVGVMDHWNPMPNFYDPTSGFGAEDIYIPFNLMPKYEIYRSGPASCYTNGGEGYQAFLNSECFWVIMWAELETKTQANEYLAYLNRYAEDQKQYGRFQRPVKNFITPANQWIDIVNRQGNDMNNLLVSVGFMFLFICLVNTIGLLLAKFLNRSHEISLKRALGANKNMMFSQCLTEVGLVGLIGGLLGIGLSLLGLQAIKAMFVSISNEPKEIVDYVFFMDWQMMLIAVVIAIVASVIAGLYPAWRVCQAPPADYLRAQ